VIRFQDLEMSNIAAEKWAACAIDTQIVIGFAFADILKRP
jgi:hypothetical protein